MTVAELIEALKRYPNESTVVIYNDKELLIKIPEYPKVSGVYLYIDLGELK